MKMLIILRKGVTTLCSKVVDPEEVFKEFEAVAKQLDEVLEDLKWRKPDVEEEERKLAKLRRQAKKDPGVDVATQAVVVRVLREVLDDKVAEADRLEKRMLELKEQIRALEARGIKPGEVGESGEAVPEEA